LKKQCLCFQIRVFYSYPGFRYIISWQNSLFCFEKTNQKVFENFSNEVTALRSACAVYFKDRWKSVQAEGNSSSGDNPANSSGILLNSSNAGLFTINMLIFAACTSSVCLLNMSVECLFSFQLWGYFFCAQT